MSPPPPLVPVAGRDRLPLSFAQQRQWFLDQLGAGSAYNIPLALRLEGRLDRDALRDAIQEVVRRHETLRTSFPTTAGQASVRVREALEVPLQRIDLTNLDPSERETEALRQARWEADQPFDLALGPLLRASLLELGDHDHVLLMTMHHIVWDRWSTGILMRELTSLYTAFTSGRASPLEDLPIQYGDFAAWQRAWLRGTELERQLAYWRRQMSGVRPLELLTDRPRPPLQRYRSSVHDFDVPEAIVDGLRELSKSEGATLATVLLAAWQALLSRYTGEEDIAVGVPIANRAPVAVEPLIGMFVNTLVMRTDLSGDPSFVEEFLPRVTEVSLSAYEHRDIPFERLVEELNPARDPSRNPIFQVMFSMQHMRREELRLGDVTVRQLGAAHGAPELAQPDTIRTPLDLEIRFVEHAGGLIGRLVYDTDLFDPPTIERMAGHLLSLLDGIVRSPQARLSELPLMAPAEARRILSDWSGSSVEDPDGECIHTLFEAQAAQTPEATAIRFDAKELSYRQLNTRANTLGRRLRELGVGPGTPVGICLDRSPDAVVALLGTLKAGGAWLPLDPTLPDRRLRNMTEQAGVSIVVTSAESAQRFDDENLQVVSADSGPANPHDTDAENLSNVVGPNDVAYILFTSGSTGAPKGVLGLHKGVVNRCRWTWETHPFEAHEVCCHKTALGYVDSIAELFSPLLKGVGVTILPEPTVRDPEQLIEALAVNRVTRIVVVPSLLRVILQSPTDLEHRLAKLGLWTASGETLPAALRDRFYERLPHARLLNLYGHSEASADSLHWETRPDDTSHDVPIGRPIRNTRVYVLDKCMHPTPVGVPGELYVGGVGLARGYFNNQELTNEAFVADPYSDRSGARIYRTRDLGRWLPDGSIQFLGRNDHVVKIRGHRVGLGEVEAVLGQHRAIRHAAVVAEKMQGEELRLVAYAEPVGEYRSTLRADELRSWLRRSLPDHFLPAAFFRVDEMPKTEGGKIDRQALAASAWEALPGDRATGMPPDEIELLLMDVWEQEIGTRPQSVTDSFFDIGGHSLSAVSLLARIEKVTGHRLPVAALFQAPTVAQLAHFLRDEGWLPSRSSPVPLRVGGSKTPFFCVPGAGGHVLPYHGLAEHFDSQRPLYMFQDGRHTDGNETSHSVDDLARHYLRELRAVQPEGPYLLGGECFGGKVAFEMAKQLNATSEQVARLVLIDTTSPKVDRFPEKGLAVWWWKARYHRDVLRILDPDERRWYLKEIALMARRRLSSSPGRSDRRNPIDEVRRANARAGREHLPTGRFRGNVVLLAASSIPAVLGPDPTAGWGDFVDGRVESFNVPGHNHAPGRHNMFREPQVRELAMILNRSLDEADVDDRGPLSESVGSGAG